MSAQLPKGRHRVKDTSKPDEPMVFYEAMPLADGSLYGTWSDISDENAPHDGQRQLEQAQSARTLAIMVLSGVALVILALSVMLLLGLEAARTTFPPTGI